MAGPVGALSTPQHMSLRLPKINGKSGAPRHGLASCQMGGLQKPWAASLP